MSAKKYFAWTVAVILVVLLIGPKISSGDEAADTGVDWSIVETGDVPEEVGIWVNRNLATQGVYLLPAGEARYLLVTWGEQPTGGYLVEVDSVDRFVGSVRVNVTLTEPDPDDMVIQVLTYPHVLLRLEAGCETVMVNFLGASWHGDSLGPVSELDPVIILKAVLREDGAAPNPLVVRGRARVFEATFWLVLADGHHHLSHDVLMAGEGGPSWAEFEVALTYPDHSNPSGMVIGGWDSAEDGSAIEVAFEPVAFSTASRPMLDAQGHPWAEGWIRMGVWQGFIDGYEDGTFRPERSVTRAEFIKMLVSSQTSPVNLPDMGVSHPDVRGHWVEPYVAWAVQEWGRIDELGELLLPDRMITREEMAMLAVMAAGRPPGESNSTFDDDASITPGFKNWVATAVGAGLIQGDGDGNFRPRAGLRRSEAVVVIWRVLQALA